jgi:hypothetical protein
MQILSNKWEVCDERRWIHREFFLRIVCEIFYEYQNTVYILRRIIHD